MLRRLHGDYTGVMARGQITKRAVDLLSPSLSTHFLWDSGGREPVNGFGVRVTPNGVKSYVYQYRMGGREAKTRRVTIGQHGAWTPDQARIEAKRLARLVDQGNDPADDDRERRRQAVDLAFDAYVGRFSTSYLKTRWKRWEEAERLLKREAIPALKGRPLPLITRSDLNSVWERVADRPALARQLFATMRKLFRWAVDRGDLERSPMEGAASPPMVEARDRVLDDAELRLCWLAADMLGAPYTGFYRMLIVTGQRKDEVAGLDWREIDQVTALWTLPPDRAKNGVAHIVPLSDLAVDVLTAVAGKKVWPKRGLLFTTTGKVPISGFSKVKARLDGEMAEMACAEAKPAKADPVPAWRVHDLRRTLATGFQRLGIRFEVTEATLNHISGAKSGIAGVYQRHDWAEEKRDALTLWAQHIDRLLDA